MCFCIRPWVCFRYACLKSTLCMLLHLSALIALLRGLSLSPPRCPCPVFCLYLLFVFFLEFTRPFCLYLSVEACLSPSLPFAVFALRLVGCDNVCCSSLVLSITAGSRRFPAVNSQSIYVPFGLVNSKKNSRIVLKCYPCGMQCLFQLPPLPPSIRSPAVAVSQSAKLDGYLQIAPQIHGP